MTITRCIIFCIIVWISRSFIEVKTSKVKYHYGSWAGVPATYHDRSQYIRENSQYVRPASRFPYKYWDSETWYQKYARNVAPKNNVNRYFDTNIQRQTSPFDALYNHPIVSWIRGVRNSLRRGIKRLGRMMRRFDTLGFTDRQGFLGALGSNTGLIAGTVGVGAVGVAAREPIAEVAEQLPIIGDLIDLIVSTTTTTTTTTTAATTTTTLAAGKCAKDSDCTGSLLYNRGQGGTCHCGNTGAACSSGTTTPACLGAKSVALVNGGTTETCKCQAKSCTGTDSNTCDTSTGACNCNTATKCSGTTPYCINSITKSTEKIGEVAGVESNGGTPKCGCGPEKSATAAVIKAYKDVCVSSSSKSCKQGTCTTAVCCSAQAATKKALTCQASNKACA